ncbi:hypothetical protein N7535_005424 [Penicillium sp. DV-2018c]|nr:hypothetical protein N7535_005424 [Penicillium sp. DV-2018c]
MHNGPRLKSEGNRRIDLQVAIDRFNVAASNYAGQLEIFMNKLKKDEEDPTLELHVDAINDNLEKNRNSMREVIKTAASEAGLTKVNKKCDTDDEAFSFIFHRGLN